MSTTSQLGKLHPALAALIVIVLVGVVASVAVAIQANRKDIQDQTASTQTQQSATNTQNSNTTTATTDASNYNEGTYSATGSYATPGGIESIDLTITIKDGVIISTEVANKATDKDAKQYQEAFSSGYATLIVGKDVDEVSLSRVAGSSLTSNGFNKALDQIKDDAAV